METSFASRVRDFRKHKGLSQQAFAERCGLDQSNITQMEKGTDPKQSNAVKLLAGFPDLNPDWLLLGSGPMLRDGHTLTPIDTRESVARAAGQAGYSTFDTALTNGLTSGPATVAEAENILLRQQIADKDKLIDRLWGLIPAKLGKMMSSAEAARTWFAPLAPAGGMVQAYGG